MAGEQFAAHCKNPHTFSRPCAQVQAQERGTRNFATADSESSALFACYMRPTHPGTTLAGGWCFRVWRVA
jgi:hypothetical protein